MTGTSKAWGLAVAGALLLIVLGGYLRFHSLDRLSFWQDEIHTALYVTDEPALTTVVQRVATWDLHSPLYYVLLRIEVAGERSLGIPRSDQNLRLLSALLGTLALPAVFLLGCRIFGKGWPAWLMLFLAAFNIYGVYYSQELRMYSLILLLAPLFLFFSLALWQDGRLRWGPAAGFVVTAVGLFYSSLVCLFLVGAVVASLLVLAWHERGPYPRRWQQVLGLALVCGLLYLPWVQVMWKQSLLLKHGVWTGYVIKNPVLLLRYILRSLYFHWFKFHRSGPLITLLLALIPLAGLNFLKPEQRREHGFMFLCFGFLFAFYYAATWGRPFHLGRYFAPWWPLILYFAAAGYSGLIAGLKAAGQKTAWTGFALLAIFLAVYSFRQASLMSYYFSKYEKENWRAAVLDLNGFCRPADALLVTGSWHEGCLRYYGAARPVLSVSDWRAGRMPAGCQRLVYVGGRKPDLDIPDLKEKFQTWPLKNCNMQFYTLQIFQAKDKK